PVLMSLNSSRPLLSNARSSGAGCFCNSTCGPGEAGAAGQAARADTVGLGDGVGVIAVGATGDC
ncbi:MAG: hypothetical protein QOJ33_1834, partial [Chloroflexota bacterium]|nr:hypothetical protein [Chloroflexota bacterium]